MLLTLSSCFLFSMASAFMVAPRTSIRSNLILFADVEDRLSFNPDVPGPIDMNRAKHCAEHFAACPVEEIQDLHDNLHKERLQKFAFGGSAGADSMTQQEMENLVLEEELEMQLNLLKDVTPDPTLFPEVEEDMAELPHLKDDTMSHKMEDAVHRVENTVAMQETVMEESTLETLAMCGVVLALALAPGLLHM